MALAKVMAGQKQIELNSKDAGVVNPELKRADFVAFYKEYVKTSGVKNKANLRAPIHVFCDYVGKPVVYSNTITPQLCQGFRNYLAEKFLHETPNAYFAKFKMVLKAAVRAGVFSVSPAADIKNPRPPHNILRKEILSSEELARMQKAVCPNAEVKRAFLFACYTGLRLIDIVRLKWSDVDMPNQRVRVVQSKTGKMILIPLNETSKVLLGKIKHRDKKVFSLYTGMAVWKSLQKWCANAKITKHISFHCARHTYATLLLLSGTDLKTTSELLGHSSTHETEKYAHVLDKMKRRAVKRLPSLTFG